MSNWMTTPWSENSSFTGPSNRRLYYLDPLYEKVVRVDVSDGSNEQILMDNESGLRTLNIFRYDSESFMS